MIPRIVPTISGDISGDINGKINLTTQNLESLMTQAAKGHIQSQWTLARLYADGHSIRRDPVKAHAYFGAVLASYQQKEEEETLSAAEKALVANACVSLGIYAIRGLPHKTISDPAKALALFLYASTHFGDREAHYHLGRLYLEGIGVKKNVRQAGRWLHLAADQDHTEAQAVLGDLLFHGEEAVPRQRAMGLMWLRLAKEKVIRHHSLSHRSVKTQWIITLHDHMEAEASSIDKEAAEVYLQQYRQNLD